jgi:hypothetical protein
MKKVVLFALLFAAVAVAAQAQTLAPTANRYYFCDYTNPTMHEKDPGFSTFDVSGTSYIQGIEYFQAILNGREYWDNRKVTWAKPFDIWSADAQGNQIFRGTRWEFTINPSGPQCTNTIVRPNGAIQFSGCSDGHSQYCTP